MATVTVTVVGKGLLLRQFLDLPVAVGGYPAGADWLLAAQRRRLRGACPPEAGAAAALLLAHGAAGQSGE